MNGGGPGDDETDDGGLPAPLWSPDTDVSTFAVVEIPRRLFDGPLFAGLSDRAHRALVHLMAHAWHEVPAGTLPAHPATLAHAAGYGEDVAGWCAVEAETLQHWVLCADDRLYLPDWADTIEEASRRRRKASGATAHRQRRSVVRQLLREAGVRQVERLTVAVIDDVTATFYGRGGGGVRGQERRDLMLVVAVECGLAPGADVHRLPRKIQP